MLSQPTDPPAKNGAVDTELNANLENLIVNCASFRAVTSRTVANVAATLLLSVGLTACAIPEKQDETAGWTVEQIYTEARSEMDVGRYEDAIKLLQSLESRFPFGRYAEQAQIDIAWAHYKDNERGLSLAAADRFIKTHPNHPKLDYIYYLKGLTNFNQRDGFLQRLGGQDLSERDLQAARESFDSFKQVVTRFPTSKYIPDAQQRMRYLINAMASGEVSVARFYFQRNAYIAAANRAQEVVRQYQQVPAVEEALYIMMRSYQELGLDHLSDGAKRVLELNFPNSTIADSGLAAKQTSWWKVWR